MKKILLWGIAALCAITPKAQPVTVYTTTENQTWQQSKATLSNKAEGKEIATVDGTEQGIPFRA